MSKNKFKNIINLVYACNNNYIIPLCASIKSAQCNITEVDFLKIYILYNEKNLNKNNRETILNILKNMQSEIIFVSIFNNDEYEKLNIYLGNWSVEIFYRMEIPQLLHNVDKAIYLDCDTTILCSLSELYNIDIDEYYAAAVSDFSPKIEKICKLLNLQNYFNSGVLLLNLKKMREDNIYEKMLQYAKKNQDILSFPDQDVFNVVLKNKVRFIDAIWNKISSGTNYIDCKKQNIKILHHTGKHPKPWAINCISPNKKYFFKYFNKLPLDFICKIYYYPMTLQILKNIRKKLIWYRKSEKSLILFSFIKIKLFK